VSSRLEAFVLTEMNGQWGTHGQLGTAIEVPGLAAAQQVVFTRTARGVTTPS